MPKFSTKDPPKPVHIAGIHKGEELALKHREEGRHGGQSPYRSARDSTSIQAEKREPIDPSMPQIPPA